MTGLAGRFSLSAAKAGYVLAAYGSRRAGEPERTVERPRGGRLDEGDVTLTTHAAEVTGRVVDGRGQPADNYTVIVYSVDRQPWYRISRFMKFARPHGDGSFRIGGLPQGEYFVAAVDRMEGTEGFGEWQDPSVLESLVPAASRIVLAESQQLPLAPRLIVR